MNSLTVVRFLLLLAATVVVKAERGVVGGRGEGIERNEEEMRLQNFRELSLKTKSKKMSSRQMVAHVIF